MKMKDIISPIKRLRYITYFSPALGYSFQYVQLLQTIGEQFHLSIPGMKIEIETYSIGFYYFRPYLEPGIATCLYDEIDSLKIRTGNTFRYKTHAGKTVGYGICYMSAKDTEDLWHGVLIT